LGASYFTRLNTVQFQPTPPNPPAYFFAEKTYREASLPFLRAVFGVDPPYASFRGRTELFEGESYNTAIPAELVAHVKEEAAIREILPDDYIEGGIALPHRALVVIPGERSGEKVAVCFERRGDGDTAAVLWKCVLDTCWSNACFGEGIYTELRARDPLYIFYHHSRDSIGIEGLNIKDGSRVFSFNSLWPDL
jgi:hypothetical protein